jgi:hypothetical protein
VLNDAISLYFADATLASVFVARWCAGSKVETTGGMFQVRRMNRRRGSGRAAPDAVTGPTQLQERSKPILPSKRALPHRNDGADWTGTIARL